MDSQQELSIALRIIEVLVSKGGITSPTLSLCELETRLKNEQDSVKGLKESVDLLTGVNNQQSKTITELYGQIDKYEKVIDSYKVANTELGQKLSEAIEGRESVIMAYKGKLDSLNKSNEKLMRKVAWYDNCLTSISNMILNESSIESCSKQNKEMAKKWLHTTEKEDKGNQFMDGVRLLVHLCKESNNEPNPENDHTRIRNVLAHAQQILTIIMDTKPQISHMAEEIKDIVGETMANLRISSTKEELLNAYLVFERANYFIQAHGYSPIVF